MNAEQDIFQKLKDYFTSRDDVIMAFLFWSQSKGTNHIGSDIDIGVYFDFLLASSDIAEDFRTHYSGVVRRTYPH